MATASSAAKTMTLVQKLGVATGIETIPYAAARNMIPRPHRKARKDNDTRLGIIFSNLS